MKKILWLLAIAITTAPVRQAAQAREWVISPDGKRQGYRDGGRAVSDNLKRSRESPARGYDPCESRGVSRARYAAARRRRRPR